MTKEKYFIEMLNHLETKISPKYPDYIFYLYNDKIYISYNQKNNTASLNYDKIWLVFETNYIRNYEKIQKLTQTLIEKHLKLKKITTTSVYISPQDIVEKHLKSIKNK